MSASRHNPQVLVFAVVSCARLTARCYRAHDYVCPDGTAGYTLGTNASMAFFKDEYMNGKVRPGSNFSVAHIAAVQKSWSIYRKQSHTLCICMPGPRSSGIWCPSSPSVNASGCRLKTLSRPHEI